MKRKGLSQILYLIIAASVLMMIAMVITFTATDIIGGAGGQANLRQCTGQVDAQCSSLGVSYIDIPSACENQNGELLSEFESQYTISDEDADPADEVVCP